MRRLFLLTVLFLYAGVLAAQQPAPARVEQAVQKFSQLLEGEGERDMGHGTAHWITRVSSLNQCVVELQVHTNYRLREFWDQQETVRFPIGALETYELRADSRSLTLNCRDHEKCVQHDVQCKRSRPDGVLFDCSSSYRSPGAYLFITAQKDGGAALLESVQRAIHSCHTPLTVAGF